MEQTKINSFTVYSIMSKKQIVVIGATGNVGAQLVRNLLHQGHPVTAVARPSARLNALAGAGATVEAGDLADTELLISALLGADAAFLMIPPNNDAADFLAYARQVGNRIADAVQVSGLRKVVHLSSIGADLPSGTGPIKSVHWQEACLNQIEGLEVVHLRPAYFMENLLANIPLIEHMGFIGSAMRADMKFPMVATRDIAARAAQLLTSPIQGRTVQYLLGPRNYSLAEAAHAIGAAIGRPELPYMQFPYEQAIQGMIQAGLSPSMADLYDELAHTMNAEQVSVNQVRTPDATTPTTLEEFARYVFAPAFLAAQQVIQA